MTKPIEITEASAPEAPPALPSRRRLPYELWIGASLLLAMILLALLPTPMDPSRIDDPTATRLLPPGTRLEGVAKPGGGLAFGTQVERQGDRWEITTPRGKVRQIPIAKTGNGEAPDAEIVVRHHWLGTDKFGRDLLSRLMQGARISLAVSALAVLLAALLGVSLGALAALSGRWVDAIIMRGVDSLMSLPSLFVVIALATIFRPSTILLIGLLGGASWMPVCRIARGEILSLKERDFITASRGLGLSPLRVTLRHLLPNALTPLVVEATLLFGNLMLTEAALSYIGFGVQPPTASWGNMLREGQDTIALAWWPTVLPGVLITMAVLSVNLLGDALRDYLDPRSSAGPRRTT
ncbi:MAG: ABC transporter permease [Acidobacteriota bacterium]